MRRGAVQKKSENLNSFLNGKTDVNFAWMNICGKVMSLDLVTQHNKLYMFNMCLLILLFGGFSLHAKRFHTCEPDCLSADQLVNYLAGNWADNS